MREERLSKLQRWVLERCLKEGKPFIERRVLSKEYKDERNLDSNNVEVTLTKSLRNLRDKDYVELLDTEHNCLFRQDDIKAWGIGRSFDERFHKVKYISLTEQGLKKARELLLQN